MKNYFVYILTNKNDTVLYTGYTNNLTRRIWEHKSRLIEGFSKKYNVDKLVYFESFNNSIDAMHRENQIKAGSRKKKIELINKFNPEWRDLYNFNILYE
jgi:putative endonuclease